MPNRLADMGVFAQVIEAGSFTAAAARMGVSKSLVSRRISALESALTVKLLNRSTRKLSLTEAGTLFHEHCRRVVQEADYAERRLTQSQSALTGVVRMTCVQAFALRRLMPALGEFQIRYPEIRIRLSCSNRTVELDDEGYDVGIRICLMPDPHLVARRLAINRKILCAAPVYLARRGTPRTLADLADHDGVLFPPLAPRGRWTLARDGQQHGVSVQVRFETDDMDAAHAAVLSGLALGVLPDYVAAADLRLGRLVALLADYTVLPDAGVFLVYRSNQISHGRKRGVLCLLPCGDPPKQAARQRTVRRVFW